HKLTEEARKVRDGLMTRGEMSVTSRSRKSIDEHIDAYRQSLLDADITPKHADPASNRLKKLFKIAKASTLRDTPGIPRPGAAPTRCARIPCWATSTNGWRGRA